MEQLRVELEAKQTVLEEAKQEAIQESEQKVRKLLNRQCVREVDTYKLNCAMVMSWARIQRHSHSMRQAVVLWRLHCTAYLAHEATAAVHYLGCSERGRGREDRLTLALAVVSRTTRKTQEMYLMHALQRWRQQQKAVEDAATLNYLQDIVAYKRAASVELACTKLRMWPHRIQTSVHTWHMQCMASGHRYGSSPRLAPVMVWYLGWKAYQGHLTYLVQQWRHQQQLGLRDAQTATCIQESANWVSACLVVLDGARAVSQLHSMQRVVYSWRTRQTAHMALVAGAYQYADARDSSFRLAASLLTRGLAKAQQMHMVRLLERWRHHQRFYMREMATARMSKTLAIHGGGKVKGDKGSRLLQPRSSQHTQSARHRYATPLTRGADETAQQGGAMEPAGASQQPQHASPGRKGAYGTRRTPLESDSNRSAPLESDSYRSAPLKQPYSTRRAPRERALAEKDVNTWGGQTAKPTAQGGSSLATKQWAPHSTSTIPPPPVNNVPGGSKVPPRSGGSNRAGSVAWSYQGGAGSAARWIDAAPHQGQERARIAGVSQHGHGERQERVSAVAAPHHTTRHHGTEHCPGSAMQATHGEGGSHRSHLSARR